MQEELSSSTQSAGSTESSPREHSPRTPPRTSPLSSPRWTNPGNARFYTDMGENIEEYAKASGLDNCRDFEVATPYLPSKAKPILEIGSGYGRIIKKLLAEGFTDVHAVERDKTALESMKNDFANQITGGKLTIHADDIINFQSSEKFTILWMWCGICDFPGKDQLTILAHLAQFMDEEGRLICDLPVIAKSKNPNQDSNVTGMSTRGELTIDKKGISTWHGHLPSNNRMRLHAKALEMDILQIRYSTKTDRWRTLHIFSKIKRSNTDTNESKVAGKQKVIAQSNV